MNFHFKNKLPFSSLSKFGLATPLALLITFFPQNIQAKDLELKVGIIQRFGDELEDEITVMSTKGDSLTITFSDLQDSQTKTVKAEQVTLNISSKSLENPQIQERLILGDHATFETAEDDAKKWQTLGIKTEITQPERWQVWAKRDVYNSPLLKRFLLNSLKNEGYDQPYLETVILLEKPEVSWQIGEQIYQGKILEITTPKNLVQVREGKKGNLRLYGGSLKIQPNAYGDYTLVNKVPLETYLRGVVPHEIGSNAPIAAAEAQTIIARTYALRNTRRFQADNYELCATTHCQVYYGLSGTSPMADRAIASTKGLVLTYQNELVDALYSSTTGGITASFSDIWNGEERPYLKSVIDSPNKVWDLANKSLDSEENFRRFINLKNGFNETGRKVFRWHKTRSLENLTEDLQKYLEKRKHPLANFTTIKQIEIVKRSPSGRILQLNVETDLGLIVLEKTEVRSAFAPPISTLFYLEPIYNSGQQIEGYAFIGGGFGHGVGLSQFGSYKLAQLGWSAQQILLFYYPNTTIQPLNETIVFW
jgi:SpoIID/LytB domain protein